MYLCSEWHLSYKNSEKYWKTKRESKNAISSKETTSKLLSFKNLCNGIWHSSRHGKVNVGEKVNSWLAAQHNDSSYTFDFACILRDVELLMQTGHFMLASMNLQWISKREKWKLKIDCN